MAIQQQSIAVLPFINLSADPENEYFSDGITEEIINALTKVANLKVTARTSSFAFKGKDQDIRAIAQVLGVANVLEGSVRKAGKRIRVTAQLIQASDGFHLWSRNFDRELADIFALQDEISLLIADQIRENFGHFELQERLVEPPTASLEAYNWYLKGRYHQLKWNNDDLHKSVACFEKSVKLDPTYALAHFGLVQSYGIMATWAFTEPTLAIQLAGEHLEKGMHYRPDLPEGHYTLASVEFWNFWNFQKGHEHYSRALKLNPAYTDAHVGIAELYTAVGEFDAAMEQAEKALELNPLSATHLFTKGNVFYYTGRYAEAIAYMHKILEIDPQWKLTFPVRLASYILLKDKQSLDHLLEVHPDIPTAHHLRALYDCLHYGTQEWSYETDHDTPTYYPWELYSLIYSGQEDRAMQNLREGIKDQKGPYVNFRVDPFLQPLRKRHDYQQLVQGLFGDLQLASVFPEPTIDTSKLTPNERRTYQEASDRAMEEEELYLDTDLSLKKLADHIGLHANKLSWLLNEHVGKNFNEYVNSYRLEAFKTKALSPDYQHITLLGLAYESGFNSKSVFNQFFKESTGTTPRQWLKRNREK
jgi:TolB-like protein/AraC-like DNA-binding protein